MVQVLPQPCDLALAHLSIGRVLGDWLGGARTYDGVVLMDEGDVEATLPVPMDRSQH